MRSLLLFTISMCAMACQTVEGDRILAADLLAANPAFAPLDPALAIGSAPLAGVRRIFRADELTRIAQAHNIVLPAPIAEICFERATDLLTPQKLMPALRLALAIQDAEIEILDFSHSPIPHGAIEFTPAGLSANGIWHGRVSYGENRSTSIWVKTKVTTRQTWVESKEPLESGKPIAEDQLILQTASRFPFGPAPLASIAAAAGRIPTRTIKPGEPIFATMLVAPHEVERGDKVTVEVSVGEAKLSFEATAQTSGRAGALVLIRNPESGRNFQARVEGKGKVLVTK